MTESKLARALAVGLPHNSRLVLSCWIQCRGQTAAAPEAARLQQPHQVTFSFNIYDVCYATSEDERRRYIEYIDEEYNADRLTQIPTDVAEIIGANILNIARQDYDPQGASVTILISEEPVIDKADAGGVISDAVVAHLDKVVHITVHTHWKPTRTMVLRHSAPISMSRLAA